MHPCPNHGGTLSIFREGFSTIHMTKLKIKRSRFFYLNMKAKKAHS
jgi:hypothetical protein